MGSEIRPQLVGPARRQGRALKGAVGLTGAAIIGLFWAGLLYHLDRRQASVFDAARGEVSNLAVALEGQVERLIVGADQAMRFAQGDYARNPTAFDLEAWARRANSLDDVAVQVAMADERGDIVATKAGPVPGGARVNVSDQAYFGAHAARDDLGLYIDRAVRDRVTGRYAVQLARRLSRSDGSFAGVIVVSLDPGYLEGQFRTLDVGENGSVTLLGRDGHVRARSPAAEGMYERSLRDTPAGQALFEHLDASASGTSRLISALDGSERLFAYRRLTSLPLVVSVGKSVAETLRPYRAERDRALAIGAGLTGVVLALLAWLLGELERRRRREADLDEAHQSLEAAHCALADKEAFLRGVIDGSPDCIKVLDLDGTLRFISHNGLCMMEADDPSAVLGRPFSGLWPHERQAEVAAAIARAASGEQVQFTAAFSTSKGTPKHLDVVISPVRDASGRPEHLVAISRDITHVRSAEASVQESEARYRLLAEHATDLVIQCDLDLTRRYVSPASRHVLGYEPHELVGTKPFDIVHPDDAPRLRALVAELVEGRIDHATLDYRYRRKDGVHLWTETTFNLIRDAAGQPSGYVASIRDISERHAAEAALARKTALLELTLENMDQGLIMVDADGTVPVSNRQARELLELPPELMATRPAYTAVREYQRRARRWGSLVEGVSTWVLSDDRRSTDVRSERRSSDGHVMEVRTVPIGDTGGVVQTFTDITHLKRAEEAMREAEALFRGLFESSTDLLFVYRVLAGGSVVIEAVNPNAARAVRCRTGEIRGKPVEEVLPPRSAAQVRANIARVIETGQVHRTEDEEMLGSSLKIWEAIHVPLRAENGSVARVFVSTRDITHLRAAEAAVREKTALLEATLENMDQGLLVVDAAGTVPVCNRRAIELLDLPPALAASRPSMRELVAYLDRHGEYEGVPEEIRTGVEPCLGEVGFHTYERTRPNGSRIEVRTVPLPGGGAVRTFTDITAMRAAEQAVRESEARYRLLADNTSDLILLGHADGQRSYISPAVTAMLGYTVEEAHGVRMREWVHPGDLGEVFATTAALTLERPTASVVYRLRHKEGRYIWAEAAFRRVEGENGDFTVITAIRDVTERQARTDELRAARDAAELARAHADRASQAKTDFLAAMSHEIRTPLNAIIGFTGLILDTAGLPAEARRHAENVSGSGQALLTVINDILDFSEVEAGAIRLEPKPFAPLALVDNTLSIVRGLAVNKRLEIKATIDPDLPAGLVGDEARLRQILLNLLNNAVKFTRRGYVALAVRREGSSSVGEMIRFSVTDTGIGIPKSMQDRLFRDFSQVDGSIRREFGGTGLGLAITKRLVELMGGTVGVFSEEGQGATFWFTVTLPRGTVSPPLPSAELGDPAPPRKRGRLLLVEDVPVNQKLACLLLEAAGHAVAVVSDGPAAIEAARSGAYDLVLMDVQMPGMDGMEATRAIRALGGRLGRVPIIAMTANVLPDQVRQFRAAGMDDHVAKPINRSELYTVIERWLPEPGASAPEPGAAAPAEGRFERATFDQMVWLVGPEAAQDLVANLCDELEGSFAGDGAAQEDRARLRREAHKLVPATSMLGFRALSEAVAALQTACEEDLAAFESLLDRTRRERDWALEQAAALAIEVRAAKVAAE